MAHGVSGQGRPLCEAGAQPSHQRAGSQLASGGQPFTHDLTLLQAQGGHGCSWLKTTQKGFGRCCGLSIPCQTLSSDGWEKEQRSQCGRSWERLDGLRGWAAVVGAAAVTLAPLGGVGVTAHSMERQGTVDGKYRGWPPTQPSLHVRTQHASWLGTSPGDGGIQEKPLCLPPALSQGPDVWSDIAGCFWEDVFSEKINISFGFS